MPAFDLETAKALATALGVGLLVGAVRERRKADAVIVAGLRTHGLAAMAGAVSLWIDPLAFAVTVALVGVFVALSYRQTRDSDPGLTSEIALVAICLLGGLAMRAPPLAAGLGVVMAVLLYAKKPLHRLTRELMSEREVHDGLVLLASALVVLPLIPDRTLGPFGVFNPAVLWTLVVLVMAISALGHVALRVVGNRRGLAIAGFFAGYVSSTAAVAGFGQRVREAPALLRPAVGAAMLANLASLSLFVPILLTVSPALLEALWLELAAVAAVLLAGGLLGLRGNGADSVAPPTAETKMFQFRHSLVFAAVIAAVLFLSAALNAWVGPRGAMAVALVAALGELHAAVATVGNLYKTGVLSADEARLGLVGLLAASGTAKAAVAWVSGGRGYALRVAAGLGLSVLAAMAVLLFT
jgi:uncharacterized membrane protein (DUF4010 family)